ncbi:MAG: citrate synthase [Terracoccus sp.]
MTPPPGASGGWITTTEAAARLGVKRATLYAYVSRGLLRSERRPGQQESLFDRAQVDAMASPERTTSTPRTLLRFRSVASGVSRQVDGDLAYRGVALADVVALGSLERAAGLVLGVDDSTGVPPSRLPEAASLASDLTILPLERRIPVAVQLLAATDPFHGDTDPGRVRSTALALLPAAVALAGGAATDGGLAPLLLGALGGHPDEATHVEVLRVLLVALLDHGLTASTVAARVAASTRAGLHDCLSAAYAAMAGPLHGAAPSAAYALVAVDSDPVATIGQALRDRPAVPGFGHFLYPEGDPRAALVLAAVWDLPGTAALRERVEALARAARDRTGALPNIDLASAAALHALGLPAAAGEVVFQVARSYGVAAHVVEEYAEEPLRWRGRESLG